MIKRKNWINLPNLLTALRILLVPALLIAFFHAPRNRQLPSLMIFLAAGLTDCLDGYLARRFNQITTLGKVLDPIADKLITASALICLAWLGAIEWLALGVIVVKEIYMGIGASFCLKHRIEVASDIYGKLATLLFYPAVMLCWPWHEREALGTVGHVLVYVSVALSVIASVHYTIISVKKWKERKAEPNAH